MIDVSVQYSPGWWMKRLADALVARRVSRKWRPDECNADGIRPPLDLLNSYYRNEQPLPRYSMGWGAVTIDFLRLARMNYAALVTESVANRLMPIGWRTSVDSDRDGDAEAMRIATSNQLQIKIGDIILGALNLGDGYAMLGEPKKGSDVPVITAEDAREFITAHDPRTDAVLASLKMFHDEWGDLDYAYLCLPGRRWVAVRKSAKLTPQFNPQTWSWDDNAGGADGEPLPAALADFVPAARFRNRDGVGEFERHLPALDRINDGIFDRISTMKHQAHRQRGLQGAPTHYPDGHPLAGEEIVYDPNAFTADPGSMWLIPPGVNVWESQVTDLTGIRMSIKDDVEALAAVTFTPLHYINPDAANGSAEGATTMREAHIFRVEDRARRMDAGLSDLLSLAFRAMGDTDRADGPIDTIWAPIERFSIQERMTAAASAKQAGLTQASIFTDVMGYTPGDLPRLADERTDDALFAPLVAPPAAPAAPGAAGNF